MRIGRATLCVPSSPLRLHPANRIQNYSGCERRRREREREGNTGVCGVGDGSRASGCKLIQFDIRRDESGSDREECRSTAPHVSCFKDEERRRPIHLACARIRRSDTMIRYEPRCNAKHECNTPLMTRCRKRTRVVGAIIKSVTRQQSGPDRHSALAHTGPTGPHTHTVCK